MPLHRVGAGLDAAIWAKLEMRNPCGSVKDRIATEMVCSAERDGSLHPGTTIVEATGGNTGIGLAMVAATRGYRLVLTMPETMSTERVALLRHLGAEVELTPGILMRDAVRRARRLAREIPGAISLDQFANPANPEVHRQTTGPEIVREMAGPVDAFVSAVGTGGTITGVGQVLRHHNPNVLIAAVEPENAAVLSGGEPGEHQIPGIGVGFVPAVLDLAVLDEIHAVSDRDAFQAARRLAREEGIVAGASSGAALHAALAIAARADMAGRSIVVLLADTGERYVTTDLFAHESW